ncbi:MAG: hypothetical protein HYS13_13180 [Planctomycetia bacterium]|nr:hypothetical protein [Planctomycetia bacterium]
MTTVRAHFDGHVFVPESPVELPVGYVLEIPIPTAEPSASPASPFAGLLEQLEALPVNSDWPADGASQHDHYLYGTPTHA